MKVVPMPRACVLFLFMILAGIALTSCAEFEHDDAVASPDPTSSPIVRSPPAAGTGTPIGGTTPGRNRPQAQMFRGSGVTIGQPVTTGGAPGAAPQGDITLNFVNTDTKEVVKAILGDLLKENYTIDANVQGQVTIQTSQPLAREAVLSVLEQSLRAQGVILVRSSEGYRIAQASDAVRGPMAVAGRGDPGQPGFGTTVVPLRYVGAQEMRGLLDSIAPPRSIVSVDPARNLLVISGTAQERRTLLENVAMFDVDYLAGMSFALFSPRYTDARSLARELGQVTGGTGGPMGRTVRFVTLERLNAVLAITSQPSYLERLRQWVARLDQPGDTVDRRIFIYRVQNGRASDLAGVLTKALGIGAQRRSPPAAAAPPPVEAESAPATGAPPVTDASARRQPGGMPPAAPPVQPPDSPPTYAPDGGVPVSGLSDVTITADEPNNSLVVVASPRDYAVIESALARLDVVPMQVLLEAVIAEVTLTSELRYGVQYYFQNGGHELALTAARTSAINPTYPGFSYAFSTGNFRVVLDALQAITRVNVVSSPHLMVLNNQTAALQVGDQVPIATQQAVSTVNPDAPLVNTIQYRDTGIILKITPRVNQGGMVMVDIAQEVSDVSSTTSSQINSPTIQQRKISSSVAVLDGQTIALGGLIRNGRTRIRSGVPFLQDIPLLGALFRTTDNSDTRTELLILVTPRVVDSADRARVVSEELRRKLPAAESLIRRTQASGNSR